MDEIKFDENTIIREHRIGSYYPIEDLQILKEKFKDMFKPPSMLCVTAEWIARFNNPVSFVWLLEYAKVFSENNNKKNKVVKEWK